MNAWRLYSLSQVASKMKNIHRFLLYTNTYVLHAFKVVFCTEANMLIDIKTYKIQLIPLLLHIYKIQHSPAQMNRRVVPALRDCSSI